MKARKGCRNFLFHAHCSCFLSFHFFLPLSAEKPSVPETVKKQQNNVFCCLERLLFMLKRHVKAGTEKKNIYFFKAKRRTVFFFLLLNSLLTLHFVVSFGVPQFLTMRTSCYFRKLFVTFLFFLTNTSFLFLFSHSVCL